MKLKSTSSRIINDRRSIRERGAIGIVRDDRHFLIQLPRFAAFLRRSRALLVNKESNVARRTELASAFRMLILRIRNGERISQSRRNFRGLNDGNYSAAFSESRIRGYDPA